MKNARNPVKSVQTVLSLVELLQDRGRAGITELANELGVSKGTVHCHLSTLRQEGYIVKEEGKYCLSLRFVDIAHDVRNRNAIYDIVKDEVDRLATKSGELAMFTVEEQFKGVCLYRAGGEDAVQTELYVGYQNGLHHTAVGKAILAFKPPAVIDTFFEKTDYEALTENTITDEQRLRDELEEIREHGFAYNRGETIDGLAGIGAPIRDQNDDVYGAISVIGPSSRMDDERLEDLSDMIHHTVNVIEINATSV